MKDRYSVLLALAGVFVMLYGMGFFLENLRYSLDLAGFFLAMLGMLVMFAGIFMMVPSFRGAREK